MMLFILAKVLTMQVIMLKNSSETNRIGVGNIDSLNQWTTAQKSSTKLQKQTKQMMEQQ